MLRSEVLKLYRDILRTIKKIPDDFYRKEMAQWARDDFKKNKHLSDEVSHSWFQHEAVCLIDWQYESAG